MRLHPGAVEISLRGVLAFLLNRIENWQYLFTNPVLLALTVFQIWMLIHAVRNREWLWAVFLFLGWGISAFWYYFAVYRDSASATSGFELPGAQNRKRIQELQAQS